MSGAERNRRWKQRHREAVRDQKRRHRQCHAEEIAAKKRAKRNAGDVNPIGPEHHSWIGEAATYETVHERLRNRFGKANEHKCIDCGKQAAHWCYDHSDPDERRGRNGLPYSTDLWRYDPRCTKCHNGFDKGMVA